MIHLFLKKQFLHHFWTLSEKFLVFCPKLSDGVLKTAFCISIGTLRGEIFFRKNNSLTFLDIEQNWLSFSSDFFRQVRQKRNQRDQGNILRRIICFWNKVFIYHFGTLNEQFLVFCQIFLNKVVQTAFYVYRGKNWGCFSALQSSFLSILQNEWKRFDFWSDKSLSELHSKCTYEYFEGKSFFL